MPVRDWFCWMNIKAFGSEKIVLQDERGENDFYLDPAALRTLDVRIGDRVHVHVSAYNQPASWPVPNEGIEGTG